MIVENDEDSHENELWTEYILYGAPARHQNFEEITCWNQPYFSNSETCQKFELFSI